MFEELFIGRKFNIQKALEFGFEKKASDYLYETDILDGAFLLKVFVTPDGDADTKLIEKETCEEYTLYKTSFAGTFVGQVRQSIEQVLAQVVEECFEKSVFKSRQAKEVIDYVRNKYGDEPEFLWEKFPENAIFRRKDSAKWYGAILSVAKRKLGIDSSMTAEIIDLRAEPEKMSRLLQNDGFFPGWHMNKKNWYTIILDGTVATDEICKCIDESHRLAVKQKAKRS